MVYDIEFVHDVGGKAETLGLDIVRLVGADVASAIAKAEDLYRKLAVLPRPDGFREEEGAVVYEFVETPDATPNLHLTPLRD